MKTLPLLTLAIAAATFSACSEDPPPKPVHHSAHHDTAPAVGRTTDEGADNFQAVQKPDTYSGH